MVIAQSLARRSRTKTVVTVGPACQDPDMLRRLVDAGADVFRLNMAHGARAEHERTLRAIRQIEHEIRQPLGVLVDLAGPKIRLGDLESPVYCNLDEEFVFVRGSTRQRNRLTCSYPADNRQFDQFDA